MPCKSATVPAAVSSFLRKEMCCSILYNHWPSGLGRCRTGVSQKTCHCIIRRFDACGERAGSADIFSRLFLHGHYPVAIGAFFPPPSFLLFGFLKSISFKPNRYGKKARNKQRNLPVPFHHCRGGSRRTGLRGHGRHKPMEPRRWFLT